MLYISRCIDDGVPVEEFSIPKKLTPLCLGIGRETVYGVVDTEDGTEEFATRAELIEDCCTHGVGIVGVAVDRDTCKHIVPYQDAHEWSRQQLKAHVVCHVDITLYKGEITSISWDSWRMQKPVAIRLSNFGFRCGSNLFEKRNYEGRLIPYGRHMLTLILDDRLMFSERSFFATMNHWGGVGKKGYGVVFDIREVRNEKLAEVIYYNVAMSGSSLESVIDGVERKQRIESLLKETEWYPLKGC